MRGRGNQEFRGCSNIRRPAVLTSVFMQADLKAVTWVGPGLLRGRLSATETYERAYKGHMVKVRVLGAAQRLTSYYNIQQNTARIARTDRKAFYQGEYTVSV